MEVQVNGQPRSVERGATVAALLCALGLGEVRVAVEVNRQVIPRARHATHVLQAEDTVEIVHFVGGG
ncbi:MAG: sulfur carrier protein ThiS [Deltaproteobacteria bacterium]|nr:sulfur carrier protein ThiS [Deltaproteobacteria bacterium]